MITKENLLVGKICSRYGLKPELRTIAFYGDRTVATDSFRLMEVPCIDGERYPEPVLMLSDTVKIPKGFISIDEPKGYEVKGHYPDIDQILEGDKGVEYIELSVNGALFGELLVQMSKLNKFGQVRLKIPTTPYKAIRLEADYKTKTMSQPLKARGLMMPMNK